LQILLLRVSSAPFYEWCDLFVTAITGKALCQLPTRFRFLSFEFLYVGTLFLLEAALEIPFFHYSSRPLVSPHAHFYFISNIPQREPSLWKRNLTF
jgi:hypothetical protein